MTPPPDSGPQLSSVSEAVPPPAGGFAFPALPLVPRHPETVVNPEGRGASGSSHGGTSSPSPPRSSVWNRLFPLHGSGEENADEAVPDPAGFELGHFVLQERIGVGGMGAVFRALDTRLQRIVALKVLGPAQSRDDSSVKRFQNEARAAARLDHDNVARVYFIGEDCGLHFIAFEFISGPNLRDLIREHGQVSPAEAVNYTIQIAGALNHTQAAGVVHRDIKPSNIILTPTGRVKLVDLGLARKQNSDSIGDLTMAGTTLGTFDYISPEQAKDPRTADVRSDIYSLGCTLYHLLTGAPPYPDGTMLQKLLDHQAKDPPDPAKMNPHVPPELSAITRKMMASDPKHRYTTPEDLLRDLIPVAASLGLRSLPADGVIWKKFSPPTEGFWERHLGWIASVAALLLIVFLIGRFPSLGNSSPNSLSLSQPEQRSLSGSPTEEPHPSERSPRNALPSSELPERASPVVEKSATPGNQAVPSTTSPPGEAIVSKPSDSSPANVVGLKPNERTTPSSAEILADTLNPKVTLPPIKLPFEMRSVIEEGDEPSEDVEGISSPAKSVAEKPRDSATVGSPTSEKPQPTVIAEGSVSTPPPALPSETDQRPYWILRTDGSPDEQKPTLEAACAAAQDGNVIEIRHTGPLPDFIKKPIRIKNKSLTIRAADNARPLLEFAGVQTPAEGLSTRLFQLSNASVDLINLDFQLAPRAGVLGDQTWAIASLEGNGRVRLQRVSVTVDNPANQPAAIVELLSPPTSQTAKDMKMMTPDGDSSDRGFEIEVSESFLRGGCDLFISRHTLPGRIEVERSAIAVEGSLLYAEGNLEMLHDLDYVELRLNHVTCLVGNSLIRLDSGDTPRDLLPIHVTNTRNNLIVTNTSNPLISMTGDTEADVFQKLLRWDGEKNFYDGFDLFWSISSSEIDPRGFESWTSRASSIKEVGAQNAGFAWKGQWPRMEYSDVTSADLTLDRDEPNNLAVNGATDASDVGADLARLPNPPQRQLAKP